MKLQSRTILEEKGEALLSEKEMDEKLSSGMNLPPVSNPWKASMEKSKVDLSSVMSEQLIDKLKQPVDQNNLSHESSNVQGSGDTNAGSTKDVDEELQRVLRLSLEEFTRSEQQREQPLSTVDQDDVAHDFEFIEHHTAYEADPIQQSDSTRESELAENKNSSSVLDDYALALQLQEEEQARFEVYEASRRREQQFLGPKISLKKQFPETQAAVGAQAPSTSLLEAYRNLDDRSEQLYVEGQGDNSEHTRRMQQDLIENMMRYKISVESHKPNWPVRNRNLKGQGGTKDIITKHDRFLTSQRNIAKLDDIFSYDHKTGSLTRDFTMSNKAYNSLNHKVKKQSGTSKSGKGTGTRGGALDDEDIQTHSAAGTDKKTRLILQGMLNNGHLEELHGPVAAGKESRILYALGPRFWNLNPETKKYLLNLQKTPEEVEDEVGADGELIRDPRESAAKARYSHEYAIKLFLTTMTEFKTRGDYIKWDHRFSAVQNLTKQNPRKIVMMWAEKEFKNLSRIHKAGIPSPCPIKLSKNVLLMTFLGRGTWPAPQLKATNLSQKHYYRCFIECVLILRAMYTRCKLVHADFSEYNLIYHQKRCYVIDVGQALVLTHPMAEEFLLRDCVNILEFFRKRNLENLLSAEQLKDYVIQGERQSQGNKVEDARPEPPAALLKVIADCIHHFQEMDDWAEGLFLKESAFIEDLFQW